MSLIQETRPCPCGRCDGSAAAHRIAHFMLAEAIEDLGYPLHVAAELSRAMLRGGLFSGGDTPARCSA